MSIIMFIHNLNPNQFYFLGIGSKKGWLGLQKYK